MLALPAAAQGTVAAPGQGYAAAAGAQKGPPPAPQRTEGRAAPASAERRAATGAAAASAPPAPYTALAVAPPKPYTDPSLAAFRKELAAIAQKKDRAALAKLVLAQDFFWLKEEGNAAGKKTGIEALATALSLAAKDGSGWETLSEFAADETAAPYPDRPNTVCSPAGPEFNAQDAGKARRGDQDRCRRLGLHRRRRRRGARLGGAERAGDREARHASSCA